MWFEAWERAGGRPADLPVHLSCMSNTATLIPLARIVCQIQVKKQTTRSHTGPVLKIAVPLGDSWGMRAVKEGERKRGLPPSTSIFLDPVPVMPVTAHPASSDSGERQRAAAGSAPR